MKVLGIVAEYNPFHKGHLYHIKKARELTGADYVVAIMSGDFMQRGIPAMTDKYSRTKMALQNGVDLVLELPVYYSTSSAEFFAGASVALLDKLSVVTDLCYGSECGDQGVLAEIASVLVQDPDAYREALQHHLKSGKSFPFARSLALSAYLKDSPSYMDILSSPNNILGIEYEKALIQRKSSINSSTIKRQGADYHDTRFSETYSSALSIRNALNENCDLSSIKSQVPSSVFRILQSNYNQNFPIFREDFSLLLHYMLLLKESKGFSDYLDVSNDLSDKIVRSIPKYQSYEQFCDLLKSKELTYARISRALLHIMLDIKESDFYASYENDYFNYATILGFKEESAPLLSAIKKNSSINLISKNADAKKILSPNDFRLFQANIRSTHIYQSVLSNKFQTESKNSYQISPCIM